MYFLCTHVFYLLFVTTSFNNELHFRADTSFENKLKNE